MEPGEVPADVLKDAVFYLSQPTEYRPDMLESIIEQQHDLQVKLGQPTNVTDWDTIDCSSDEEVPLTPGELTDLQNEVLKHTRPIMHEVVELEDWFAWKHWSRSLGNKVDKGNPTFVVGSREHIDEIRDEAIDILHFLVNIFMLLNMDADTIYNEYVAKNSINHGRSESGDY